VEHDTRLPRLVEVQALHRLLALTPTQLRSVDGWEGNPSYYRRRPFTARVLVVAEHPYRVIDALVPRA